MRSTGRLLLLVGVLTAWSGTLDQRAAAQEMEVILGGEMEYQNYCAVCHGADAKGQGLMSRFLTIRSADLTPLAKNNSGTFSVLADLLRNQRSRRNSRPWNARDASLG
jgi:hypothetical protein